MSSDDPSDSEATSQSPAADEARRRHRSSTRHRLDADPERADELFDERIIDVLTWLLDTETRARIYLHLRKHPDQTSGEIASGTDLYPSTVRESLAALHAEGIVNREKRAKGGAGNNPYEYTAIAPRSLVSSIIEQIQAQLNTVCELDRYLGRADERSAQIQIKIHDDASQKED